MRLLVKIGGAQLEEAAARSELACSVAAARDAGHELVLVHGGGNQIRERVRALGLVERYHEGLRVTDAATADVVLEVLAGAVNKALVRTLNDAGVAAVGLCGADGASFVARRLERAGVELGYVGEVDAVDPRLIEALLAARYVPVLATVAPLANGASAPSEHFYNINADMAAGALGRACKADAIVFLTDVPGVLDGDKQKLALLTSEACAELQRAGVIHGGMLPKVEAALAALRSCPRSLVKIAPAAGTDSVLRALRGEIGTAFQAKELATHA